MIRAAKFGDMHRLLELLDEMYQRSKYKGRDTVDRKLAQSVFMQCIQRHGLKTQGGACVFVGGEPVESFIVGVLDRVYHVGMKLMATDMYFYASPRASARCAPGLLAKFLGWAKDNENVIEIKMGATDAIEDWSRVAEFYERKGMRMSGVIYERTIER